MVDVVAVDHSVGKSCPDFNVYRDYYDYGEGYYRGEYYRGGYLRG